MGQLRQGLSFTASLYRQKAAVAYSGYVRRDPMSLLRLRPGRDDPYTIYDRMRGDGTLSPTMVGNWVTTSHRVCSSVLRDRRFGVRPADGPPVRPATIDFDLSLLDLNPPDHTRLRRLAQPAFSPKHMAGYRPLIERNVDALLDRALAHQRFDLVPAFAAPLPIAVITALLGIPDAHAAEFARYGAIIGGAIDGVQSLSHAARLRAANARLEALFGQLFALRRREPADDVVSRIVAAEGDEVHPHEMLPLCSLLLLAGFETTINLIGNAVNALLDFPEEWEKLCADPEAMAPKAVEEALRFDPPVQRTGRFALQDMELEGRTVRAGEFIIVQIGAANRDPEAFPDPHRFDITREPTADHLAFSSGIHYCLGAPLGLLEAAVALRALAQRVPDLRRAAPVRRRNANTVRGPISLPVRVGSTARRASASTRS